VTAGRTGPIHRAALAQLAESSGDYDRASRLYDEAAEGCETFGITLGRGEAHFGSGRCLLELGRLVEAAEKFAEARAIFSTLGAQPLLQQLDELAGEPPARMPA
jgi:tetratricopeptide (TPR) repeat protein